MIYEPKIGDVVQIDPQDNPNPMFAACMLTVTKVKDCGVQGYVQALGEEMKPGGQAYINLNSGQFAYVGKATWVLKDHDEEQ